jgi:hypothetical protein
MFVVFLLLVVVSAALEVILVFQILSTSQVSNLSTAITAINSGGLAVFLVIFARLVQANFAATDMVTEYQLSKYFEGRLDILNGVASLSESIVRNRVTTELVRECLRLAESILKDWIGEYHYELSVFENKANPIIIAYYESGGEIEPRSKYARDVDPEFYRTRRYEVVELLENPANKIIYLTNTRSSAYSYSFLNEEQRNRIGSSILYCFCNEGPRAIVITCDKEGTFTSDRRLETLVRALGTAMRAEYAHDKLVASSI